MLKTPLDIIYKASRAEDHVLEEKFRSIIAKLYRYEIFKPILDLTATLCFKGLLTFVIYDRRFFELDEGNCRTIESGYVVKMLNRFRRNRLYTITIKSIQPHIIVHELAHMMEKECIEDIASFDRCIMEDVKSNNTRSITLQSAVKQVLVVEVNTYPVDQRSSELFARFFQLVSMAKEVQGYKAEYSYALKDVYQFFERVVALLSKELFNTVHNSVDKNIALYSQQYIVPVDDIEHKWSEEKVQKLHHQANAAKKWQKAIKSIKDY
ncbi:hypothetical protein EDM53_00415 [Rickettsiales endosymbiont of Peranema trichophorum]|uniref:WD_0702 family putative metalloprotease n=1 Tax=Rickettsiales endosymbiont of Peranema trichophorum TaxID=2486577 RepID=UPI0010233D62|nr:hypothetical protein [Rickettsiales endosymbiont of Peranema trichophorum]RZI47751.1 hypothetical protein EDM53_00415 [Rickettsiales endosymbiont of Peranema trichophorum]